MIEKTSSNIAGNIADNIAVLATCLADALRPQTVRATCTLVERACNIPPTLPKQQTCCGQVLYNAGDRKGATQQALRVLDLFEPFAAVVVPSGSCAGMLKRHYPQLLAGTKHARRAVALAQKSWELTEFLCRSSARKPSAKTSLKNSTTPSATPTLATTLTWHDSCSCLRECNDSVASARSLLLERGFRLHESSDREVCCGFGGKFSIANSAISTRMADDKLACLQQSGAKIVASCDLGCLLHLAGRARRRAMPLSFFHIAELLVEQKPLPIGD